MYDGSKGDVANISLTQFRNWRVLAFLRKLYTNILFMVSIISVNTVCYLIYSRIYSVLLKQPLKLLSSTQQQIIHITAPGIPMWRDMNQWSFLNQLKRINICTYRWSLTMIRISIIYLSIQIIAPFTSLSTFMIRVSKIFPG